MYDLCIIGCGAAGMSAAIEASKYGMSVIILEKNNKAGKKLYATGNGRCNLTNKDISIENHYNSSDLSYGDFLCPNINNKSYEEIIKFVEELDLEITDINNYIYPRSKQASSVVWAMLDRLKDNNVKIEYNAEVTAITYTDKSYKIKWQENEITASQLIIATGGASYKSLGGSKSGYNLIKQLNIKQEPVYPSLCSLKINDPIKDLQGVRASCKATLYDEDNIIASEEGELQLLEGTLSGIVIFNLSSKAIRLKNSKKNVYIKLDYIPEIIDVNSFIEKAGNSNRTILGYLNGYVNDKLCSFILAKCNIDKKMKANELTENKLKEIFNQLKNMAFTIKGYSDLENAQVSMGGVSLKEINPNNYMTIKYPNLYIIGEALDIDGLCGGYNLTFAIISGKVAGKNAYVTYKSN